MINRFLWCVGTSTKGLPNMCSFIHYQTSFLWHGIMLISEVSPVCRLTTMNVMLLKLLSYSYWCRDNQGISDHFSDYRIYTCSCVSSQTNTDYMDYISPYVSFSKEAVKLDHHPSHQPLALTKPAPTEFIRIYVQPSILIGQGDTRRR